MITIRLTCVHSHSMNCVAMAALYTYPEGFHKRTTLFTETDVNNPKHPKAENQLFNLIVLVSFEIQSA